MALWNKMRSLYFKVISLPEKGYLARNGKKLVIGDRFSPAEVVNGDITYTSTTEVPDGLSVDHDYFRFGLWKTGFGDITAADYSDCFGSNRAYPTPEDGVFEFEIRIHKDPAPILTLGAAIVIAENETVPLDASLFTGASTPLLELQDLIYTVDSIKHGHITVQGRPNNRFTESDLRGGKVLYHNDRLGDGVEQMEFTLCTRRSKCVSFSIKWAIKENFKQTGDNVIYAKANSEFYWEFQSSRPDTLWELLGGTQNAPQNASTPSQKIVEWSTYATTSSVAEDHPDRGYGYDKLPQYRNLREIDYWEAGLPKAMSISSYGSLGTGYRLPASQAGTQPWKTPKVPGSYFFTLIATDPRTGDMAFRRYNLVVTFSGTSVAGITSESKDL